MRRVAAALLALLLPAVAQANDHLTVMLDWFPNPDHAPLLVAEYIHAYDEAGLDVTFVPPADPTMPVRLVAAKHGDIAIGYQPMLYHAVEQGLPVVRVGALVDHALNAIATLDIPTIAGLKGKRIGIASTSAGVEEIELTAMLASAGLTLDDVIQVNIGQELVPPLLIGRVDAVPVVKTFEAEEIRETGKNPILFSMTDYGVPDTDQFIYLVHRDEVNDPRIARFLAAVKKATAYLEAHPDECWAMFVKAHPDLDNPLNKSAWQATLPYFARDPFHLDRARYDAYADFLVAHGGLKARPPVETYTAELSAPPS
jgi:putative hydroxymethylpyrimidine transport system substrate-binding protein